MEVNKLQIRPPQNEITTGERGLNSDLPLDINATAEAARIDIKAKPPRSSEELRVKLNDAINLTNVATEGSKTISAFVGAIEGLVEQAGKEDITPERRGLLEKEANQLLEAIKRTASDSSYDGIKPLAGDKIRLEIEERLGKALEVILPDDAKEAFGLNGVSFSRKEAILATSASIARARQRIDELSASIDKISEHLKEITKAIDAQPEEQLTQPEGKVRSVDGAIDLAQGTNNSITAEPKKALGSVGEIEREADILLS